jgi:hypothetical protein
VADPADEERYLVVDGRRWRRQDPALPEDVAARLRSELGGARSEVGRCRRTGEDPAAARVRVGLAKHGLGERGTPWWEQTPAERQARWEAAVRALSGSW